MIDGRALGHRLDDGEPEALEEAREAHHRPPPAYSASRSSRGTQPSSLHPRPDALGKLVEQAIEVLVPPARADEHEIDVGLEPARTHGSGPEGSCVGSTVPVQRTKRPGKRVGLAHSAPRPPGVARRGPDAERDVAKPARPRTRRRGSGRASRGTSRARAAASRSASSSARRKKRRPWRVNSSGIVEVGEVVHREHDRPAGRRHRDPGGVDHVDRPGRRSPREVDAGSATTRRARSAGAAEIRDGNRGAPLLGRGLAMPCRDADELEIGRSAQSPCELERGDRGASGHAVPALLERERDPHRLDSRTCVTGGFSLE